MNIIGRISVIVLIAIVGCTANVDKHDVPYNIGYDDGLKAGKIIGVDEFISSRTPYFWCNGFNGEPLPPGSRKGAWIMIEPPGAIPANPQTCTKYSTETQGDMNKLMQAIADISPLRTTTVYVISEKRIPTTHESKP